MDFGGFRGILGWVGREGGREGVFYQKMMDDGEKMGFSGYDLEEPLDPWEKEPLEVLDPAMDPKKTPLGRQEGIENTVGTMP